jgi:uncharacterized protein
VSGSVTEPAARADRATPWAAPPLPLGFLGLAVASFSFATVQLGWIGPAQGTAVALCIFFFTVPLQLLASVAGFVRGELAPATGMAVLAGTWAAIALTTYTSPAGSTSKGLGVVLCATGAAMVVPACGALARPWAAAVMAGAAVRFWTTAGFELTAERGWQHVAGWVGLVVAVLGFVVALLITVGAVRDD